MTYSEACKFFHQYGGVGRNIEELISAKPPTLMQLEAACFHAEQYVDVKTIEEAKQAILKGPDDGKGTQATV
jgi:hypothetical protein